MKNHLKKYFVKNPDAFYLSHNGYNLCRSVHGRNFLRFNKAKEEATKDTVPINIIIGYVNEFLSEIGVQRVENPIMNPNEIDYLKIKEEYQLKSEKDIVWMKFTADGYLGAVAQSNDINFDIPTSSHDYDTKIKVYNSYKRKYQEEWKHNSAGILIHQLNKKWNKSFVLVFPLHQDLPKYDRHEIETAIGNYLIDKQVPILDYYSHNY